MTYAYLFMDSSGNVMKGVRPFGDTDSLQWCLANGWAPLREVLISNDFLLVILQRPDDAA
jgi:hypothetical protein